MTWLGICQSGAGIGLRHPMLGALIRKVVLRSPSACCAAAVITSMLGLCAVLTVFTATPWIIRFPSLGSAQCWYKFREGNGEKSEVEGDSTGRIGARDVRCQTADRQWRLDMPRLMKRSGGIRRIRSPAGWLGESGSRATAVHGRCACLGDGRFTRRERVR